VWAVVQAFRVRDAVDIVLVAAVLYRVLVMFRGTRAVQMLAGLGGLIVAAFLARHLELFSSSWILENFWSVWVLALVVLFQPEFRRGLAQIGHNSFFRAMLGARGEQQSHVIDDVVKAAESLAGKRMGGLIVLERTTGAAMAEARPVADGPTLEAMIRLTRQVPVPDHVTRHAVDLVIATHPDRDTTAAITRYVRFGASPRAAQAMVLAAKATALLDGRPSVAVDDVRAVAPAALRHRLVLGYEAAADDITADDLVTGLLDAVGPPAVGLRGAP